MKQFLVLFLILFLALPVGAARVKTSAPAASLVVSAGPARLLYVVVYNANAATQFVQVHNAASLPANGAVAEYFFPVAGSTSTMFVVPSNPNGDPFDIGIVVCNSSTAGTKTIGAADCWFTVRTQ